MKIIEKSKLYKIKGQSAIIAAVYGAEILLLLTISIKKSNRETRKAKECFKSKPASTEDPFGPFG
jgi:hypothetical protein